MKVVVDRFEGKYAIFEKENKDMIQIEKNKLPTGVKEGTVLRIQSDKITIDTAKTKKAEQDIKELMDGLWD